MSRALTLSRRIGGAATAANSTVPSDYRPGQIRRASDGELDAVMRLCHDIPEFAKQPHDVIVDAAAGFVSDVRQEERSKLREEGVPADWRRHDETTEENA